MQITRSHLKSKMDKEGDPEQVKAVKCEQEDISKLEVPLFLKKLWKILYDDDAYNIIEWNAVGDGFIIYDQIQFMMQLLPKYFKHNNMSSFVRQLNMYGFHKRQHSEKDGEMEFFHDYFLKDVPELLKFISRKVTTHKNAPSKDVVDPQELESIYKSIRTMKSKQTLVDTELKSLKQENGALWSELNNLRMKHAKQTQIINKLIHFLVHYMHSSNVQKRSTGRLPKENKGQSISKRPGYFELEYKGNNPEVLSPVKKQKTGHNSKKDEGPTIFELEHNDCPNEYWKKYDEKMSNTEAGQHIVTEPDEDDSENVCLNPNINEVFEPDYVDMEVSNILGNMANNEKYFEPVPPKDVLDENIPSTSKSPPVVSAIPNITDKTSITLDKVLGSKENFNKFLDSTQNELNSVQETLSGLSQTDIANLLELFESNVPLPIESGDSPKTADLLPNPKIPDVDKPDGKPAFNPDDMLNLTNEIDSIQGENNLMQGMNLDTNADLSMSSADYLQEDVNGAEILNGENVDLDNIIDLLSSEAQ